MRTVKVRKDHLISIITENKSKHRDLFVKAFEGYRQECVLVLTENLEIIKRGVCKVVVFTERAPEDHSDDYDTVLAMLAMSVDDTIELTHQEFRQYVEDDWSWREQWAASNMKYTSR